MIQCLTLRLLEDSKDRIHILIMHSSYKPQALLALIAAAALVPFLNKTFSADDRLFVWMAQQIAKHPLDLVRNKSADAALLFLWLGGTFCFAAFFNWSIIARAFLPMAPPARASALGDQ